MTAKLIVVSDATPLIALAKIGQLSWLPDLFGEVLVPAAVYTEIVVAGAGRSGAAEIQSGSWIRREAVVDRMKVNYLFTQLDIGEAEAIVLAQERQADWLLVDEIKARTIAQRLGLQMMTAYTFPVTGEPFSLASHSIRRGRLRTIAQHDTPLA